MHNSELLLERRKKIKSIFQEAQVEILKSLIEPNKKVLEVGCGYGFFVEIVGKSSLLCIGVDKFLKIAPSVLKNKNIRYIRADGEKLPFKDSVFDIVYSMDVIEHIEDVLPFISESLRVLKKAGILLIGTPNRNRLSAQIKKILLHPNRYPLVIKDEIFGTVTHIREYTKQELIDILKNFKVRIEKIVPIYFGLTDLLPWGVKIAPVFLENLCQFWLFKIRKI